MSLRNISNFFKIKKNERSENEEIYLPIEGFEQCIYLLLAYSGQDVTQLTIVDDCRDKSEGSNSNSPGAISVLRYLGRCHGLSGADPFEDLEIDQIVDVFNDFILKVLSLGGEQDPELKMKNITNFNNCEVSKYLSKFDAIIAANNGHLALNKLTWADFLVVGMWGYIKDILDIDCDTEYTNIKSMVDSVTSHTGIKSAMERIKNREQKIKIVRNME